MALSDLLKNTAVKILIGFIAGVLATAAILLTINPKNPPEGVLTCENSDVGVPVSADNGTIIDYDNLDNMAVVVDLSNTNPVFSAPHPACYDISNSRFILVDANGNRADGWQGGKIFRVVSGGVTHDYDCDVNPVGLRKVGTQICVYQSTATS